MAQYEAYGGRDDCPEKDIRYVDIAHSGKTIDDDGETFNLIGTLTRGDGSLNNSDGQFLYPNSIDLEFTIVNGSTAKVSTVTVHVCQSFRSRIPGPEDYWGSAADGTGTLGTAYAAMGDRNCTRTAETRILWKRTYALNNTYSRFVDESIRIVNRRATTANPNPNKLLKCITFENVDAMGTSTTNGCPFLFVVSNVDHDTIDDNLKPVLYMYSRTQGDTS